MSTVKNSINKMNRMNQRSSRLSQIAQGPVANDTTHNVYSDIDLQALRDSVSDPTGLRPHFEKLNENVQKIDNGLESEREERRKADEENSTLAAKWHRIDLTIAIFGVFIGILGIVLGFIF